MFIDRTKIIVASGSGGHGAVSFHREKYVNAGGPDGGDGGKGGDVIFIVDEGASTLADFKYQRKFKAENGANGAKNKMTGKSGADVLIKVPQGTLIREAETGRILADLVESGARCTIARGGKGGLGNMHFATSTRQIPNFARAGEAGKELELLLELKLLADVGLAGFPNVGKSTLLSVTTGARPEIADYPFTTVRPNLGVVFNNGERSYVMADIPGLIEGASEGQGLGHEFLRHIERTRLLIHVIDISGSEGRDPFEDFLRINHELERYNEALSRRPQVVALNKMDLEGAAENAARFREQFADWLEQRGKATGVGLGMFGGAVAMQNHVIDHQEYFYVDNYYLKLMIEMGYTGLAAFLITVLGFLANGCRALYRTAQQKKQGLSRLFPLCAGIFAGLCGVFVHCGFENIFEEPYMMAYFWSLAGLLMWAGFLREDKQEVRA